ncbi:hypothetical protein [Modestobacter sp. NPDC049651]|uniref:hypothetical protein n=1 Tax=unclassified Modestobacter TaxID=2643866 RepID=UPI0033F45040
MGLRLPVGGVTVLLGPAAARAATMAALDDDSARCGADHDALPVLRLSGRAADGVRQRLDAVDAARASRASLVLVDRLTEGLAAGDRRTVLTALSAVASSGRAVLVDDDDPVAALAVADGALRTGTWAFEPVPDPTQLERLAS